MTNIFSSLETPSCLFLREESDSCLPSFLIILVQKVPLSIPQKKRMKASEVAGSSTMMTTTSSFRSGDLSGKYQGMIELSTYKKVRNSLFTLFDYVSQTAPTFFGLHAFISIWRIIQFFGPATCANFDQLWGEGSLMQDVWNILSVLYHIVPTIVRHECDYIVMYIFVGIFIVMYIFLAISAYTFTANAKLPHYVPIVISLFFSTVGYIFAPVVTTLAGELIGRMIMFPDEYVKPEKIVSVVLTFIEVGIYAWLYSSVYALSIMFKPDSLMTAVPIVQVQNVLLLLVITFLSALASQLSKWPCVALTALAAACYAVSIPLFFSKGGYVNENYVKALSATAVTGCVLMALAAICVAMGAIVGEYIILIIIALWIVSFIVVHFVFKCMLERNSHLLDLIEDDANNFHDVHSARQIENLIIMGFRMAHPVCINFQLLKLAIDKYPTNIYVWLLFAKFTAIYPEETQQLSYISVGIQQNRLKGSLAKHTQQQINSIMRQRETNLLPELKSKLDKIGKHVQGTKHKVRYIWDLILQGNVKELESVVDRAYHSIDHAEAEFLHLLRQFPNSRFVARAYARFLRDVIADHAGHKTWAQNVAALTRGMSIAPDLAHDLGIRAFPHLPQTLDVSAIANNQTQNFMTDDTLTQDIDTDDEQAAIDAELRMSVRESINRLKIPSFKMAKILRILSLIILFVLPVIAATIAIPIVINDMSDPLEYMYEIADIRTKLFQAAGSSLHYAGENLEDKNPERSNITSVPFRKNGDIEGIEEPPASFGGTYDSREQAVFFNSELSNVVPGLNDLMSYQTNNPTMDRVRYLIFGDSFNFTTISDPIHTPEFTPDTTNDAHIQYNVTRSLKSAHAAIMLFILYYNDIVELPEVPYDAFNRQFFSVTFNNIALLTDQLTSAIETLIEYVIISENEIIDIVQIVMIVIVVIIPIYYILTCALILYRITKEKLMIYKCLASLPKNVVSRVADSFKVLKKDDDDEMRTSKIEEEELNKQEENMLKIFATSTDSHHGKATDMISIIITTILVFGLHVAATIAICQFLQSTSHIVMQAAPHIDHITGAYAYDLASLVLIHLLPVTMNPKAIYTIVNFNPQRILNRIDEWSQKASTQYKAVRFGNEDLDTVPFSSLGVRLTGLTQTTGCDTSLPPRTYHDIYGCWESDLLLSYSRMTVKHFSTQVRGDNWLYPADDILLSTLWHINQVHLFDYYFRQMFINIIPIVNSVKEAQIPENIAIIFALLIVAILIELVFLRLISLSENRQKFALRLLLHCPGSVVVSNPNITTLLAGNFAEKHIDSTNRNSEFYDVLVQEMPDSIIIMNLEGKITTVNKATPRVFDVEAESLIGQPISTAIGQNFKDENPFKDMFEKQDKTDKPDRTPFEKHCIYIKPDKTEIHVEISFIAFNENLCVTTREVTQTVMYNKLISDERARSDRLLSSILPPKLVPRVQNGEKNISFAVQSVSILFMDIVSFTPWCGSLPAATVMKTLNLMFKEYDSLCSFHPTMTKIKCIGDCYMAAGGIFAELNQPAVHAKDVVEFGLGAIEALEELNERIDQKLQIRVGVNTGGPIVAGVLGTEKPTFEILGPTINMAQQMEHHGVPMKVHISRAVYELIYGCSFDVKERGEIEIKNGTVVTYLVNPPPRNKS